MGKRQRHTWKRGIVLLLIGGMVCGATVGGFIALIHDLPQIRSLESFQPSAVTRIYSADQVLLAELFLEKRDLVALSAIPEHLRAALIATEDRKFYQHSGVDLKGILRAIVKNIWAGEYIEGASTITQQLAKTLFLTPRKTIDRKIKEAFLAFQLERRYTKDEILQLYLNQVYFGSGAYGVESAARIFFGKSVKDLSIEECALVAGMPKAPSRYSPLVNMDLALKRRNTVLRQMAETGIIDPTVYQKARRQPIRLARRHRPSTRAPYFIAYIKKFLEQRVGAPLLYKAGLTVQTTLNHELQTAAENAMVRGIASLQQRMKQNRIPHPAPQGALVSLDVQTGGILAMVGGNDFYQSPFNRAVDALRQPGSAFKPFVYAHAIEQGFSQNQLILDAPILFKGAENGKDWTPQNFSKKFLGEMTLRKALAISENIPAVRLIEKLGPSSTCRFAARLGIRSRLQPNLSLALGTSEVSLIDLTAGYAVFANKGEWVEPHGVTRITDSRGTVIWQEKPKQEVAMSRSGAAVITDMLQGVIREGTAKRAQSLPGAIAGKTGTTNAFKDALFVGFSPLTATGVWTGQDDHTTLGRGETGARAALPIWIATMKADMEKRPVAYFDMPDNLERQWMDPVSGHVTSAETPGSVAALFVKKPVELNPKPM